MLKMIMVVMPDALTPLICAVVNPAALPMPPLKKTIADGTIFFGRGKDDVTLTLPLRDRNGDIIAAVCVRLKSFPGETQDAALTRATMVVKEMQAQVLSRSDLGE